MPKPSAAAMPDRPRQPKILNVLLPMTLPTAISRCLRTAAMIEVATSGIEVPADTMVRAITKSLTPIALAKLVAASTSQLEPSTKKTRPTPISTN